MNKGLGVFLSLLLCVVFCVGVITVLNNAGDSNGWMQKQQNSHVFSARSMSATSAVYHEGAGLGRVAVPMFSRQSSTIGSRRMVGSNGATYSSQSVQYPMGGMSSVSQSPLSYMSSSHTMKSFGGGNTGVSMSGGVVSNAASSLGSGVSVGIQSPIAYTQLPAINTQSPIVSNYQGVGNTTTTAPRGMRGRRGVGSMGSIGGGTTGEGYSGIENSWLSWLANSGLGYSGSQVDGSYGFNIYQLQDAYDAWLQWWISTEMGGETPDEYPSFDEFLSWFWKNDGQHTWSGGPDSSISMHWVPVGDVLPLLVLAMLYVVIFFVRRNKTIQL